MTKKDYELIASVFNAYTEQLLIDQKDLTPEEAYAEATTHGELAAALAEALALDNDKFDRDRFLKACGVIK